MASVISKRTYAVLVAGLVAIAAIVVGFAAQVGGEMGALAISDFGGMLVIGASAVVVLWVALSFGKGEQVRTQWLAIGIGVLMFAIGEAVWSYFEVIRNVEPAYPGPPDVFYLLLYPPIAYGLMKAGLAYNGLVDLRRPAIIAAVVTVVLGVVVWLSLIGPHIVGAGLPLAEAAISTAYPAADLLLALGPAVFVLSVVAGLGTGRFAWPWWAVTAGTALVALSDSGYSYLTAYDRYQSGSFIDYGWSLGFLLVAVGASIAYDLAHPA